MSAKIVQVSAKTLKNRKRRAKRNAKLRQKPTVSVKQRKNKQVIVKKKQKKTDHTVVLQNGMLADDRDFRRTGGIVRNSSTDNYMNNLAAEIAFDVTPPSTVFYGFPAALTSLCLQRGWMAGAENPSVPFLAFGYLCYILQSFALNAVLPVVRLPRCFALACQAVTSKSVPASGGKVNYKFTFDQDATFPFNIVLGPTGNALYSLTIPDASSTTGVWQNSQAPTTWSLAAGQTAYQSLTQWLEVSKYAVPGGALELVPSNDINKMSKDVSAFAVTYSDPGGGYNFTGGFGKQVYLEVPIHSPLFSAYYSNPTNVLDVNRYADFTLAFAGSSFMQGLLATLLKEKWAGMKTPPTLKCIDLNEFNEVYAIIIQKGLTNALMDPETQVVLQGMSPADIPAYLTTYYQCPITLLEFTILIRDVMMNLLKDTQFAVQDTFPRSSANLNTNLFTACTAGTNTCALGGSTSMLFPRILVENMRACTFGLVQSGKNGRNPIFALPILGVYSNVTLDENDYNVTITVGSTPYSFPVFKQVSGEQQISLIDGTTPGDAAVVFINDPGPNNMLVSHFNTWLDGQSQAATFISSLTSVGTDAGVNVLTNMNLTTYWTPAPDQDSKLQARKREYWKAVDDWHNRTEKDKKMKEPVPDWKPTLHETRFGRTDRRMSHLDTSSYANSIVQAVTCRFPLVSAVWEGGQQFFIQPVIDAVTEGTVNASNQISRIAAQQREFYLLITSIGSNTTNTLAYRHDMLASMCVCTRNGASKGTDFETQLATIATEGGGGIFNDIVSAFESVAVPLVKTGLPLAMGMLGSQRNVVMGQKNAIMGTKRNMIMGRRV